MKLSVNEAKLSGLWARNCATFRQVLSLKFAFGLEKLTGPFEKRAPGQIECEIWIQKWKLEKQIQFLISFCLQFEYLMP